MSKALIAYFSQGGTTLKVSNSIAEGLRRQGFHVDLYNIQDNQPPDIRNYDLFGIGAPVYSCEIPFNVQDYLHSLPQLNNMPVFSFNLYGTYPYDAGKRLRKILAKKAGRDMGYFSCRGADYFLGYLRKGYFFSPNSPKPDELKLAEDFGNEIYERINGKTYDPTEKFASPGLVYRLGRLFYQRWIVNFSTRFFKVNAELCNTCNLCIKSCPNHNVKRDPNGQLKWGNNCLGCFTCEMKCSQDAIKYPWNAMSFLFDYLTHRAANDKTHEWVKVRHSKGRTERI
jgi:flavodoxin/Pyruvate/2-oxoacid:ferredoxin oxidoreductase delta subunit